MSYGQNIFKELLKLSSQIISVRVLYILASMLGMIFIARLGTQELAAGALATSLTTTVIVIGMSPLFALSTIVGRSIGAEKFADIGKTLRIGWLLSIILGVVAFIIFWKLADFLKFLGQPPQVIPLVRGYFHGLAWGSIPTFAIACCHQFFFPVKKGNIVMICGIVNFILVCSIGIPLTFGINGVLNLGMSGWAYATSITNWTIFIWALCYLYFKEEFKPFKIFSFKDKASLADLKFFFALSFPITVQYSGELIAFSVLNIFVGWLGVFALSIQQIVIQCSTFALMFPMGAGQSSSILISHSVGAGKRERLRKILKGALVLVSSCMAVIAFIYLFLPHMIISIYISPEILKQNQDMSLAVIILAIAAVSQFVDAIRNVCIGALRGLYDVWQPMWVNFVLLWVIAIPLSYLLGFRYNYGLVGLNLGFLLAFSVGALLMFGRFWVKTSEGTVDVSLNTDVV